MVQYFYHLLNGSLQAPTLDRLILKSCQKAPIVLTYAPIMTERHPLEYPLTEWVVEVKKRDQSHPILVARYRLDMGFLKKEPNIVQVAVLPLCEDLIYSMLGIDRLVATPGELIHLVKRRMLNPLPEYFQGEVFDDLPRLRLELVRYGDRVWQRNEGVVAKWLKLAEEYEPLFGHFQIPVLDTSRFSSQFS